MNKIWILARMTFREAVRRRIVLIGLVLGVLFLIIFSIGFHMIYAEHDRNVSRRGGHGRAHADARHPTSCFWRGCMPLPFSRLPWERC